MCQPVLNNAPHRAGRQRYQAVRRASVFPAVEPAGCTALRGIIPRTDCSALSQLFFHDHDDVRTAVRDGGAHLTGRESNIVLPLASHT
jgi:hypothetical protein